MINPAYNESWQQAREVLEEQGFVLLAEILDKQTRDELLRQLQQASYSEEYQPALHRYDTTLVPQKIHDVLETISQKLELPVPSRTQQRRYKKGSYTLQDDDEPQPCYDYTLLLCEEWDTNWRGELTYAHPQQEALRVPPQENALLIVKRDEDTTCFTKRVNHHASSEYYATHATTR